MIEQQQWQWFSEQLAEFDDRLEWLRDSAAIDTGDLHYSIGLAELETCREELRVAEEELRTQHEELISLTGHQPVPAMNDRLLDDLPVATLASDRLGVLTAANRPAAQLLGEPAHQIAGKPLAAYLVGDRKPFRQLLGRLASGERHDRVQVELRVAPANGMPRRAMRAVLIARRDGDDVRWVVVPDDVFGSRTPGDHATVEARENAHVAIESLSRLSITTDSLTDLLAKVEDLAATALPAAGAVTLVLDTSDRDPSHRPGGQPFPLHAHGARLGVMYVSDGPAGRLDPADQFNAQLFADAAAAVVSNVRALHESRVLVRHLSHALEHRPIIEQAKGILMAVRNCDEDAAFDYLRVVSQQSNTKLHEVARELVATMTASAGSARR